MRNSRTYMIGETEPSQYGPTQHGAIRTTIYIRA